MTTELAENVRKGIISFSITDKGALYAAYMQFVKDGGVFVPTNRNYDLGDNVFMLLKLMDNPYPLPVEGKIVWITPTGAQGNKRLASECSLSMARVTRLKLLLKNTLLLHFEAIAQLKPCDLTQTNAGIQLYHLGTIVVLCSLCTFRSSRWRRKASEKAKYL